MRRRFALAGIGLLALAAPALAETPPDDPARTRAATLQRLQAQLTAEQRAAQELAGRLAAAVPPIRHARTAHAE